MGVAVRSIAVLLVVVGVWVGVGVGTDPSRLQTLLARTSRRAVEFAAAYPVLSGLLVAASLVVVAVPFGIATVAYARQQT